MVEDLICFRIGISERPGAIQLLNQQIAPLGDKSELDPPVPIPNTAVKRLSADDTEGVTPCGKYAIARGRFLLSKKSHSIFPVTGKTGMAFSI